MIHLFILLTSILAALATAGLLFPIKAKARPVQSLDVTDIEVCTDCVLLIANGEFDGECEHGDSLDHVLAMVEYQPIGFGDLVLGDGDEIDFSTSRCEGCGSTLAGSRHPAAILTKIGAAS